jgi:hypothetical protein
MCFAGCLYTKTYSGVYLFSAAVDLRYAQGQWQTNGQPSKFDLYKIIGPTNLFFIYTNTVTTSNSVYHCLFGARRLNWPPGVLAVTDIGIILWIRDRDGNVTIEPESHGVER